MDRLAAKAPAMLHEDIVASVGRSIVGGEYPPGSTFTLEFLCSHFSVSRTVAREAMRILEKLGMVRSRRRVGIVVQAQEHWDAFNHAILEWQMEGPNHKEVLRDLNVLRIAVEPIAASLAATRDDQKLLPELEQASETMRRLKDPTGKASIEYVEADIAFHEILVQMSGNSFFMPYAQLTRPVLMFMTTRPKEFIYPSSTHCEDHYAVFEAISKGQASLAEKAMRIVVDEYREAVGIAQT
ncbi:MAG: FadR/GntR family transcriptional regulator [Actinomycetaceae bacterium]|nr:FadR/GntR family transcriptional regulator [Actinomycetaceae bacterium]